METAKVTTTTPKALRYLPHLAVASVGYVLFASAAVPDVLMNRFSVEYTALGLVMSAALLAVVIVQPFCGYLTKRTTTTRVLLAATAAHGVFAVALDHASGFEQLLILRVIWGLPAGIILSVGGTHIARLYTGANATRQQGIFGGMLTLGGVLGFLFVPFFVSPPSLLGLYSPSTFLSVPALAILWWYRGDRTTAPQSTASTATPNTAEEAERAITHPVVIVSSICYIATLGSYITLSTFITAYYDDLGVLLPLNILVLFAASSARVMGGTAVHRWTISDRRIISGASALAAIGFVVMTVTQSPFLVAILPIVTMLAVSFPFGSIYRISTDNNVNEGSALAVVIAAGNIGSLVLPAVIGSIRTATGGYGGGFLLLATVNAAAVVSIAALRLFYSKI
jgi:predicted MFS family arabinose efflux permease